MQSNERTAPGLQHKHDESLMIGFRLAIVAVGALLVISAGILAAHAATPAAKPTNDLGFGQLANGNTRPTPGSTR